MKQLFFFAAFLSFVTSALATTPTPVPTTSYPVESSISGNELIYAPVVGTDQNITPNMLRSWILAGVTLPNFTLVSGKSFTVSNTLTLAGTDGSTLNIGAGGTLGSDAFSSVSPIGTAAAVTISAAGNTTLTASGALNTCTATLTAGSGAYSATISLNDTGAVNGAIYEINVAIPASNATFSVYDSSPSGTQLAGPLVSNGTAGNTTLQFQFNGTNWVAYKKGALLAYQNLADLPSAATARTNLGLGSAATSNTSAFDASGAASTAQAASLQKSANLSDLASASTARTNLGLGALSTVTPGSGVAAAVANAANGANGEVVSNGSNQISQSTTGNAATATTASAVPFTAITNRPSFYPTDIMGTEGIWVDPNKQAFTNGATVTTLTDNSGLGTSMTMTGATYASTALNGTPGVTLSTSGYGITSFSMDSSWNTAFTIVEVVYLPPADDSITNTLLYSAHDSNFNTFSSYLNIQQSAGSGAGMFDDYLAGGFSGRNGVMPIINAPTVIVTSYNGTTWRRWINGVVTTETATTTSLGETAPLTIGNLFGFSSAITYGHILMTNKAVTLQQGALLSRYFLDQTRFAKAQLVTEGDSLTAGVYATTPGNAFSNLLATQLGGAAKWTVTNLGIGGETAATMNSNLQDKEYLGVQYDDVTKVATVWAGVNDWYNGASATTCYNNLVTLCTNVRAAGYKVVVVTSLPNNYAGMPAGWETARQTINASIRSNWTTYADGLADVGADPTIGAAGAYSNTSYFWTDYLHLVDGGYQIACAIVANAVKHVLGQPYYLTGTLSGGTCTINSASINGPTYGQPQHLWTSTGHTGTLNVTSFTAPTGGSPGQIVVTSSNSSDTDTFQVPVN